VESFSAARVTAEDVNSSTHESSSTDMEDGSQEGEDAAFVDKGGVHEGGGGGGEESSECDRGDSIFEEFGVTTQDAAWSVCGCGWVWV
jgi:hypothetical protein